jgi:hypothetical protein
MCPQSVGSIEVQQMASLSVDDPRDKDPRDKSVRAWYGRKRRVTILVAVGLLAFGAFLLWGPIGLGNGPLRAAIYATQGWADSGRGPVGFVIPLQNSGDAPAVIDGLDLIGGTSYPGPHVLRLEVLTAGRCGAAWPARPAGRGFALVSCGGADAGPLIGHAFGRTHPARFGFPAAAEVTAPRPGRCWVVTRILVHYHVGIRHYSASDPYQLAVCANSDQISSAMNAAAAG